MLVDGTERRITRRSFFVKLLGLTGVVGGVGLATPIVRYAYPALDTVVAPRVQVATAEELSPLGEAKDFSYQEIPCTILQLEDGTYRALSRVCTHFGCIVSWEPEEPRFYCPCHAGVFSPTGEVVSGPPPRPLPQLMVEVEGSNIFVEGWAEG